MVGQPDDRVLARMEEIDWSWAQGNLTTVEELEWRMERAAREGQTINYSELVREVEFRVPAIDRGRPWKIDTKNWRDIDRKVIGIYLGYISLRSYRKHGCLLSAMVTSSTEPLPSKHFFDYVHALGLLPDIAEEEKLLFWKREYNAVKRCYQR